MLYIRGCLKLITTKNSRQSGRDKRNAKRRKARFSPKREKKWLKILVKVAVVMLFLVCVVQSPVYAVELGFCYNPHQQISYKVIMTEAFYQDHFIQEDVASEAVKVYAKRFGSSHKSQEKNTVAWKDSLIATMCNNNVRARLTSLDKNGEIWVKVEGDSYEVKGTGKEEDLPPSTGLQGKFQIVECKKVKDAVIFVQRDGEIQPPGPSQVFRIYHMKGSNIESGECNYKLWGTNGGGNSPIMPFVVPID